jgi:hypothetical protein
MNEFDVSLLPWHYDFEQFLLSKHQSNYHLLLFFLTMLNCIKIELAMKKCKTKNTHKNTLTKTLISPLIFLALLSNVPNLAFWPSNLAF